MVFISERITNIADLEASFRREVRNISNTSMANADIKKGLKNFDVLQSIISIERYSELVFDLLKDKESPEEIQAFLKNKFPEEAIGDLKDMAKRGYPLSLERLQ